jgi:hypothetical protein
MRFYEKKDRKTGRHDNGRLLRKNSINSSEHSANKLLSTTLLTLILYQNTLYEYNTQNTKDMKV